MRIGNDCGRCRMKIFGHFADGLRGHFALSLPNIYVCGSKRFDPNPDDNNWACGPAWWPEDRYAQSSILARIYRTAYRKNGLGNNAEYPLCLAYGALAVRELLRQLEPDLILQSSKSLGIAVGFDSGDFVLVGKLDKQGLTR